MFCNQYRLHKSLELNPSELLITHAHTHTLIHKHTHTHASVCVCMHVGMCVLCVVYYVINKSNIHLWSVYKYIHKALYMEYIHIYIYRARCSLTTLAAT